jgi:threonine aldolase
MAITMTQATEAGTVYKPDEIRAISGIAKAHGLPLHMDGARFANALVALDLTPQEMTSDLGVDIVSFGATKNGCWCAEALVFLDPEMATQAPFIRKRAAHLFSKSRFISAQFDAYFENDLWLDIARHSNRMAARLQAGILASPTMRGLAGKARYQRNLSHRRIQGLANDARGERGMFYEWSAAPLRIRTSSERGETMLRLVTSFATTEDHVDRFVEALG